MKHLAVSWLINRRYKLCQPYYPVFNIMYTFIDVLAEVIFNKYIGKKAKSRTVVFDII